MATLDQVISQMMAADMPPLPPGHPVPDGKIVRFGPKKKAWYKFREYFYRDGTRQIFGKFGIWRGDEPGTIEIESDLAGMDPAEAERLKRSYAELEQREQAKRAERARFAANRAKSQWNAGRAAGESPYLKRKGVESEKGLRFLADGTLLVPMIRYDVTEDAEREPADDAPRRLVGLQKIAPDGTKLFNKGMVKTGAACRLGKTPKDGDLLIIAEGIATALTIRQGTGRTHTAYIAFDAGNLPRVAAILRKLYPRSPMLFCADDDSYLEAQLNKRLRNEFDVGGALYRVTEELAALEGKRGPIQVGSEFRDDDDGVQLMTGAVLVPVPGQGLAKPITFVIKNAGRVSANEAARGVMPARVCWPIFKARAVHADPDLPKLTDFNDLHAAEGLAAVEKQMTDAIAMALVGAGGTPSPIGKAGAKKRGAGKGGDAGGAGGGPEDPDWDRFWGLVNRFTLIYPTDTAYDHQLGDIVKIEHVRLKFSNRYVGMWLDSKRRRDVDLQNVVFDPGGDVKPPKLNLYRGLGVQPSADSSCEKLKALLHYLCAEDDAVFDWVLKWLAYPLQHIGAKMHTAIVMSGKEGAGKNLFFSAIRDIYGLHGSYITQRQLEADFQGWLSAKLFIVANEVVTRHEMRHQVGFIKHLITEPEVWINRKNKDERSEANHVNLVFFSNELQPMQIGPDDRRNMVIKTPPPLDREYYKAVAAELRAGGAAALLHFLLELPLEDFDEHTRPIETEAKRDLIELGMSAPQLFWKDIHDKEIELPYCPALCEILYRCFCVWCMRNGEKMPARINRFIPDFMRLNGVSRATPLVPRIVLQAGRYVDSGQKRQLRTLMMGELPEDMDKDSWVRQSVLDFANAANSYIGEQR